MLGGTIHMVSKPVGVVGAIVPWNYPQCLAMFKLAPLLAAGCTVVIKPSPETVLDSLLLAEAIVEAGLPAGVVNIVPGGRELGPIWWNTRASTRSRSPAPPLPGASIARRCGELLRPVTLELGGKSAAIVLDDADLSESMPKRCSRRRSPTTARRAISAPACWRRARATTRCVEVFTGLADALQVGDSLDPATQIGPVASARQRERVEGYIEKGRAEGARVVSRGRTPAGAGARMVRAADDLR